MLDNTPAGAPGEEPLDEDTIEPRVAYVARTRAGSQIYNTLTPKWDFAFSV